MTPADLKSTRHALGLTVEGFARALGVSGDSLRRWERGDPPGTVALICDLAMTIPDVADAIRTRGADLPRGRPRKEP